MNYKSDSDIWEQSWACDGRMADDGWGNPGSKVTRPCLGLNLDCWIASQHSTPFSNSDPQVQFHNCHRSIYRMKDSGNPDENLPCEQSSYTKITKFENGVLLYTTELGRINLYKNHYH